MLPDIPTDLLPPGMDYPKTLLINVTGTTIFQEFQVNKKRIDEGGDLMGID